MIFLPENLAPQGRGGGEPTGNLPEPYQNLLETYQNLPEPTRVHANYCLEKLSIPF